MYLPLTIKVSTDLAVASTGVVYTNSFKLGFGLYFGLYIQSTSVSSTADIKIELEESIRPPTTEGAADTGYTVPVGMAAISSSTADETCQIYTVSPKPMPYGRFKLTGVNSNPSDTLVNIYVFIQEPR